MPTGHDHRPFSFSMLLARGDVKGGYVHGKTDEIGWSDVEDPGYVNDFHATLLHLLGRPSAADLQIPRSRFSAHRHGQKRFPEVAGIDSGSGLSTSKKHPLGVTVSQLDLAIGCFVILGLR